MIYDVRTYDFKPGGVESYIELVREQGLAIRESHGAKLAGWYYTQIGTLNQVIQIWAYDDLQDMENKMKAISSEPRWANEYLPRVQQLVVSARNQIMRSPDFFPRPE